MNSNTSSITCTIFSRSLYTVCVRSAVNYRGLNTASGLAACQSIQIRRWGKKPAERGDFITRKSIEVTTTHWADMNSWAANTPSCVFLFTDIPYYDVLLEQKKTKYYIWNFMLYESKKLIVNVHGQAALARRKDVRIQNRKYNTKKGGRSMDN